MNDLETFFADYRQNIVGSDATIETPYGIKNLLYSDWIASGRLYRPIEEYILKIIGPLVGNTHSQSTATGQAMTEAYHTAQKILKNHVNAGPDDLIITAGFGMTAVVNKLQRLLGLRVPEHYHDFFPSDPLLHHKGTQDSWRPVVFVTHMEHHSNHTSWLETIADVLVLPPGEDLLVNPKTLHSMLLDYADRPLKIGAFTAASNVSGLVPDYHELARIMHRHGGYAFIDFAASAPYLDIDMHPARDPEAALDALYFSPHKFLGGPGSSGVMIFNKKLYHNRIPDHPGGGTVSWTNRWNEHHYIQDIEMREDGGTPGFLQAIRAALAVKLKDEMGVARIVAREQELRAITLKRFQTNRRIHILAAQNHARIGVISFYVEDLHHNLVVRLLNDHYGIQVRGGCFCAGTYGHYLLNVSRGVSSSITKEIDTGNLSHKPGWVRLSLHPTLSNQDLTTILDAIDEVLEKATEWEKDYELDPTRGEFFHKTWKETEYKWLDF